jgi:hypothetical protein
MPRDLTDTTIRLAKGKYPLLNGPQLAALISRFKAAGLDRRQANPGETAALGEELGIPYPAQVWGHLKYWRKGDYDNLPQLQLLPPQSHAAGALLTADELHRISDLLTEIAAVTTLLKQKLQQ